MAPTLLSRQAAVVYARSVIDGPDEEAAADGRRAAGAPGAAAGPSPRTRSRPESELDFEIDDLAAALQLSSHEDPEDDDGEETLLADDADIEELDEIVEVPDEPTSPRHRLRGDTLYLVVDGRVHTVTKDRFVIGRVSAQCDLTIVDANVSRQHCAIERRHGIFHVTDLGSTNGVEIDGKKVDDHPIESGDVLVLSGHRIECSFEPPAIEAPPNVVLAPVAPAPSPTAVTGRLAAVAPEPAAPPPAPEPELELEPEDEHRSFEARMELRLAALAQDVASLRAGMEHLVRYVESLKGVDALAQFIQRRLQTKRNQK
jgi:hypothetical protein